MCAFFHSCNREGSFIFSGTEFLHDARGITRIPRRASPVIMIYLICNTPGDFMIGYLTVLPRSITPVLSGESRNQQCFPHEIAVCFDTGLTSSISARASRVLLEHSFNTMRSEGHVLPQCGTSNLFEKTQEKNQKRSCVANCSRF
ncbi:putative trans-sialidase [Trypanosoma cruzi]|nr:putative trans-sialidase [Trypanosoma cruzi]